MSAEGRDELVAAFARLRTQRYEFAVYEEYGVLGVNALVRLLECAREFFKNVPFEMLTKGLEIVAPLNPEHVVSGEGGSTVYRLAELRGRALSALTVAVNGPTSYRVWDADHFDATYGGPHLVYSYVHGQTEEVVVNGTSWAVNDSPWSCGMATPTFSSLESALEHYVLQNRLPVQCAHLAQVWRDDARLAFVEKPERLMQRSLLLALVYALDDASVRPEQNQSETKPVDIEVTWWDLRRSAIIEVKWLGNSGPKGGSNFTTSYAESRALSGMKQLAEYLEMRDATTSDIPVMGYLFVFDGRRRNLRPEQTSIDAAEGLHYAFREPKYLAEHLERPDIGRPFRCFMEPVYS